MTLPVPKDPVTVAIEKGVEEAAETAKHYLDPLVIGGLQQGGGIISDTVGFWRWKNQINLVLKMKEYLESKGIEPKALLPKHVFPILEAGSLEVDQDMKNRWAALLANSAISPEATSPAFPQILKDLSSVDARILDCAYERVNKAGRHPTVVGWMEVVEAVGIPLPESYKVPDSGTLFVDFPQLNSSSINLVRLGLIQSSLGEYFGLNAQIVQQANLSLTPFGYLFVRACSPP